MNRIIQEGKISSISLAPTENKFKVKVDLTEGLSTNYGTELTFSQEMQGTAEIVTDDVSVFMRIMNPVRAFMKDRI